jgi:hypothetical protein
MPKSTGLQGALDNDDAQAGIDEHRLQRVRPCKMNGNLLKLNTNSIWELTMRSNGACKSGRGKNRTASGINLMLLKIQ